MNYLAPVRLSRASGIPLLLLAWLGILSMTSPALFAQIVQPGMFQQYILQQKTEKVFREVVVSHSHDVIERVKLVCQLEPAQLEKLQLAAEGDVVRFYREFERIKSEVNGVKMGDAQAWQQAWPIIMPLYTRLHQGIFDDSSLCHSVLKSTLNPGQLEQFEAAEEERRDYAFKAVCKTAIADLSREIPLTGEQRGKLLVIMLSGPKPKKSHPQMESMLGMVIFKKAIKRIENELVLDKKQLNHLVKWLGRVQGMEGNFEW